MVIRAGVVLLVGFLASAAPSVLSQETPDEPPELKVTLGQARGLVPLTNLSEPQIYSFEVIALDSKNRRLYARAETFVRPGQTRTVDASGRNGIRIHGWVYLMDSGLANYKAELSAQGRRVASVTANLPPAK